jgi:hypothetical protein
MAFAGTDSAHTMVTAMRKANTSWILQPLELAKANLFVFQQKAFLKKNNSEKITKTTL